MVGFFLPGDSLLFITGTLLQSGVFNIPLYIILPILFLATVLGNTTGYLIGKRLGRKLFERPNSRLFKKEYLIMAEKFYEKNGTKTIVLAMFIPIIRAFAAVVAGIANMPYRIFITFNTLGAFIWVTTFVLLGFYAGKVIEALGINIELAALIIIFISLLPGFIHVLGQEENRRKIATHVKKRVPRRK